MTFKHLAEPTSALSVNRGLVASLYAGLARVAKDTHAIGPLCMRTAAIEEGTGRRVTGIPRSDRELVQSWLSRGHEARRLTEEIIESHITVFAMNNLRFLGLSDLGTSRSLLERALQTSDPEALLSLKSAFESMFAKVQFRDLHFFRAVLESSFQDILEPDLLSTLPRSQAVQGFRRRAFWRQMFSVLLLIHELFRQSWKTQLIQLSRQSTYIFLEPLKCLERFWMKWNIPDQQKNFFFVGLRFILN